MIKYTLESRKPTSYLVDDGTKLGVVQKTGDTTRSKRWVLQMEGEEDKHFRSRRAAFHWFEHGKPFVTKPVYAPGSKNTKRIR